MVPSLIYLIGVPSIIAAGTGIFQIIFSGAYGCISHTISGNVIIVAAFIMILGAAGTQIGSLGTRYVRGLSLRFILAYSIFFSAIGSILKLISIQMGEATGGIQTAAIALVFTGLGLIILMIAVLVIIGIRYSKGHQVPHWLIPFLAR